MKVRVLMATLVIALVMGVQGFANPCDSACVDPCAACNGCVKNSNLFSGLKKLVSGAHFSNCSPCDSVVACNPCDEAGLCNPCDEVACNTPCVNMGGRLRNLFASHGCSPCDAVGDCTPCDRDCFGSCDPCGEVACKPKCSLPKLFGGFRLHRGCDSDCGPCDVVGNCGPCDNIHDCHPCDNACNNPCDRACNGGCDDGCGSGCCGPRGRLLDLPRINLSKLFGTCRIARCDDGGCNPCDEVRNCMPCDNACFR